MKISFSLEIGKRQKQREPEEPKYISETKPVQPHKSVRQALDFEDMPRKIPVEVIEGSAIVDVTVKNKH